MPTPTSSNRIAILDPFGGLAGDMLLGAILDLGIDAKWLCEQLTSLKLPGWALEYDGTTRRHLGCTKATFRIPHEHGHRHLPEIRRRIAASTLPDRAKAMADKAFCELAEAEARVHRIPVDHVHFHEVGAADAILDICGVSLGLDALGVSEVLCGPLPGGSGTIRCEHGDMPCPAPAVVELLRDFVIQPGVGVGEMVTPTGAALLVAWGRPLRAGELGTTAGKAGYGAGSRSSSILRLTVSEAVSASGLGELEGEVLRDEIVVLESHLDDESPEQLAWLSERLFALGAVDVAFAPLTMKKGRPGVALTAMVPPALRDAALACILRESAAIGVREQVVSRAILRREEQTLDTRWGAVRIKRSGGRVKAEYEDLARIAREHELPLHRVRAAVEALADDDDGG
ncbi:MAG: nickel pincer cofactor biosynthesis protein LarC [Myxococcales bacterium]|nr:nickel pincer cofactor biosynthesis protein LarC [Myxococcales bacterium]